MKLEIRDIVGGSTPRGKLLPVVRVVMQVDLSGFGPRYPQYPSDIGDEEDSSCRTFQVEEISHQVSRRESVGIDILPAVFRQASDESQVVLCQRSSSKAEGRNFMLSGKPAGLRHE